MNRRNQSPRNRFGRQQEQRQQRQQPQQQQQPRYGYQNRYGSQFEDEYETGYGYGSNQYEPTSEYESDYDEEYGQSHSRRRGLGGRIRRGVQELGNMIGGRNQRNRSGISNRGNNSFGEIGNPSYGTSRRNRRSQQESGYVQNEFGTSNQWDQREEESEYDAFGNPRSQWENRSGRNPRSAERGGSLNSRRGNNRTNRGMDRW